MKVNGHEFDFVKIKLASPNTIRKWGEHSLSDGTIVGEVLNSQTLNYKTLKPELDGLFCERIFGPIKNWECSCGKYKRVYYKNFICERCGVELTESSVRRHRMGYINLVTPVTHIWYLKSIPNYISVLLKIGKKELENIIYYIKDNELRAYNESSKTGTEIIKTKLENLNLELEIKNLKRIILFLTGEIELQSKKTDINKRNNAIKHLRILKNFNETDSNPSWMILTVIPVLPPTLRPISKLDNGITVSSDLNELYRLVINRNNRLKSFLTKNYGFLTFNEKRLIQEAVDALIANGKHGKKVADIHNRPFKSLSDIIKGKYGRFRQNLLGKRVDYSGRSVIVVGPSLKINQCGLPYEMAIELFEPFIIHDLIIQKFTTNIRTSETFIINNKLLIKDLLKKIFKNHPILLNRAPTLHRLGIQAFEPVIIEGRAIKLHPLVCSAFNADFDGDQMAVHVPLSLEAIAEAYNLMLAPFNFLSPTTGEPIIVPSQDMVLGSYYLTANNIKGLLGSNHYFADISDALMAYESDKIDLHASIWVRYNKKVNFLKEGKRVLQLDENTFIERYSSFQCRKTNTGELLVQYVQTTVGKLIFNNIIQKTLNSN
jgi:DNA-directed RNA polymerase subunit beta'